MKGFYSNIEAKKYLDGESSIFDVMNAADKDKFIGLKDANALDAIEEERNREALRAGARGLAGGTFCAMATCADSNFFYFILYVIGVFIIPFYMPYMMFYKMGNDYETMCIALFGGCLTFLVARYRIAYAIVFVSLLACILIVIGKYFEIAVINNAFATFFQWVI